MVETAALDDLGMVVDANLVVAVQMMGVAADHFVAMVVVMGASSAVVTAASEVEVYFGQRIAVEAAAMVPVAYSVVEVGPSLAASLDDGPCQASSVVQEHQQTIDAVDQRATMDSERPINVQQLNRAFHLWNPF